MLSSSDSGKEHRLTRCVIEFAQAIDAAPYDVRHDLRAQMEELADELEQVPSDNPFWDSMRVSRLCLVVRGWSFYYTFDGETLRVTDVRGK